jgi:cytochrome c oxidase cbb3-type subunit 2
MSRAHKTLEKNISLMAIFIVIVISIGGAVEILPLIFQGDARTPAAGITPYPPLELAGRDIYVREGCYNCHSQMIRPFRSETERYGPYSVAGESVYDRPFQWGSKRTGPDLARVGARYSDEWAGVDAALVQKKMQVLQTLGDPYQQQEIDGAPAQLEGKNEMDALIAYLQGLGRARSGR